MIGLASRKKPQLLKNTASGSNWIAVRLIGTKSNRSAIGSRVTVHAGGRSQIDEVMSGGSFYSHNDLTCYFGLGSKQVDRIEVRWPSGVTQTWKPITANRVVVLTEGSPRVAVPGSGGLH